jgi:hypothetical protein
MSDDTDDEITPEPRPGGRFKRAWNAFRSLSGTEQGAVAVVIAAFIGGIFTLVNTLIPYAFRSSGQAATSPPSTTSIAPTPTAAAPSNEEKASELAALLAALRSTDPEVRKNAVTTLRVTVTDPSARQETRDAVLQRLAACVRDRAPQSPGADTLSYCLKAPTTRYPTEVSLAMQAIGVRLDQDSNFPIDLSGVNLAYASLQSLDLRNVRFEGALLCRTFLGGVASTVPP